MGKVLRVELTTETFREVELNEDYLASFIGGARAKLNELGMSDIASDLWER